eukprot:GEMP01029067.1.p1 GENE.GEMP01029067.1~~GEMP01029067.1.p1  ORF type:complete len:492 (+),score=95.35 GEMP01029067.1:84-1478(+)
MSPLARSVASNILDLSAAMSTRFVNLSAAMSPPPHACFPVSSPFNSPQTSNFSDQWSDAPPPKHSSAVEVSPKGRARSRLPCYSPNGEGHPSPALSSIITPSYFAGEYSPPERVWYSDHETDYEAPAAQDQSWRTNYVPNYDRYQAAEASPKAGFDVYSPQENGRTMSRHSQNYEHHSPPAGAAGARRQYNVPNYGPRVPARETRGRMADLGGNRERDAFVQNARIASHQDNRYQTVANEGRPRHARAESTPRSAHAAPPNRVPYRRVRYPAPTNFSPRRASDDHQHGRRAPRVAPPDRRSAHQNTAVSNRDFHAIPHHQQQLRHGRQRPTRAAAPRPVDKAASKAASREEHALFSPGAKSRGVGNSVLRHTKRPAAGSQRGEHVGGERRGEHPQSGGDRKKSVSQRTDGQRVDNTSQRHKSVATVLFPQHQGKGRKRWSTQLGTVGTGEARARGTCTLIHSPE